MQSFAERITRHPIPWDADRTIPDRAEFTGTFGTLLRGTAGSSPYLARLIDRHGDWLAEIAEQSPEDAFAETLAACAADLAESADAKEAGSILRRTKARAALLIALADLGGIWDFVQVTEALSQFADLAVRRGSEVLLRAAIRRERLPGLTEDDIANGAGYCVLAMGKHGARELNYSSDIDLICLFDQSRFASGDFAEAKAGYVRVTRDLVKLLSENTTEGYVFRTDLRLRPAPSTTPVCMAMEAAETYYESVGRTWERAAHIKARPVAGDIAAGKAYLKRLSPFIWRRYLDFAAIEDTYGMLGKIREKKGRFRVEEVAGTDIKLSPGGIREIEFFAQTRQLIQGGREPRLRGCRTLETLTTMRDLSLIDAATHDTLSADYIAHRTLEHRLQMIEDGHTHTIPIGEEGRRRTACLMGQDDLAGWEAGIAARLSRVHRTTEDFFAPAPEQKAAREAGGGTSATALGELGFKRAEDSARVLARWHSGNIPATRDERARRLYAGLAPRILEDLAKSSAPDEALSALDRFISGLPAGVQVFSLFSANPHLLELIVKICAMAPRLATYLGQYPQVIDSLLDPDFFAPLPDRETLAADLAADLAEISDYERVLDQTRRWARDQIFRNGVQLLVKVSSEREAARAYSDIAEAAMENLLPRVIEAFSERHGPPPGRGLAVVAMGKLGSREMTAGSDLDLILIYDAGDAESSEGKKPLSATAYYMKLTQMILAALTAPTAEGRLYEVDMRLRPSGRQGPVAVALESFRKYQAEAAWVWEHMALTRARPVAGPEALSADIAGIVAGTLATRRGDPKVMEEAREMRARLKATWSSDPNRAIWDLKSQPGGILDLEFCIQAAALAQGLHDHRAPRLLIAPLVAAGAFTEDDAATLSETLELLQRLQQLERLTLDVPLHEASLGTGLSARLTDLAGVADIEELAERLSTLRSRASGVTEAYFAE